MDCEVPHVVMPCCGIRAHEPPPLDHRVVTMCTACGHWLFADEDGGPRVMTLDDQEDLACHRPDLSRALLAWTVALVGQHSCCCKGAHGDA